MMRLSRNCLRNKMTFNISAIITAHEEALMAGMSLRSFLDAVDYAQNRGLVVEKMIILDKANEPTIELFSEAESLGFKLYQTDYGDQGKVRNFAVERSQGSAVAFLDADDLWGYNWLSSAYELMLQDERYIVHPEFNWFFEGSNNTLVKIDQEDKYYNQEFLRAANYWDALCLANREVYLESPYCERDVKAGFAYEDWYWNCETVSKGYIHKVVPETIHFKRRRASSQTIEASKNKTLMRMNDILLYSNYIKEGSLE